MRKYPITKNRKRNYLIFGSLVIVFFLYKYQEQNNHRNKIVNNAKVLNGATIVGVHRFGKSYKAYMVDFSFLYSGTTYEGRSFTYLIASRIKAEEYFIGKKCPVIIDSLHPVNSSLLLQNGHFEDFGMLRPDSLAWYDSLVNNNKGYLDF